MSSIITLRRSNRTHKCLTSLPETIARIELIDNNVYHNIRNEFDTVSIHLMKNPHKIAEYWLYYYPYDFSNKNHCILLHFIIHYVGHDNPLIRKFLNSIENKMELRKIGILRCHRENKMYYRLCVANAI